MEPEMIYLPADATPMVIALLRHLEGCRLAPHRPIGIGRTTLGALRKGLRWTPGRMGVAPGMIGRWNELWLHWCSAITLDGNMLAETNASPGLSDVV
jgi:hypothetical protein